MERIHGRKYQVCATCICLSKQIGHMDKSVSDICQQYFCLMNVTAETLSILIQHLLQIRFHVKASYSLHMADFDLLTHARFFRHEVRSFIMRRRVTDDSANERTNVRINV
jgi:hypothetical protein